jgi:hypothetical protein
MTARPGNWRIMPRGWYRLPQAWMPRRGLGSSANAGLVASGWGLAWPRAAVYRSPKPSQESTMASRLNPYLNFDGNARQALEFYTGVFGGNLTLSTFADFGRTGSDADKIMHGQLDTAAGYTIMAADIPSEMEVADYRMAGF